LIAGGIGDLSEEEQLQSREWFREWFGQTYLDLYPHRDAGEADLAVELFGRVAELREGERVLDLACGAGRHLASLRRLELCPVGVDLSAVLLARAADGTGGSAALVRGDMRWLPFFDASFGGVVSFFTSFAYFEHRQDDRRVVAEIRRVLRPGGSYLLDFLNAQRVRDELIPEDVREIRGRKVRQFRYIEHDQVVKRIEVSTPGDDRPPEIFFERVRLYTDEELSDLLAAGGLMPHERFGDYRGQPFEPDSPRLLISGRAG